MDRRTFLLGTALGTMGLSLPKVNGKQGNSDRMGIVVHSYARRWNGTAESKKYPGFQNALDLIDHCHAIGAGGTQVMVNGWTKDFAKKVRDKREKYGLYLEGSIGLPKTAGDIPAFEKDVINAREAGADVLRTVCLNGRRYESFSSHEMFSDFKKKALASLQWAEPVMHKHGVKLAVENHKDWRAAELTGLLENIDSEWVGVTLDFGNSIALLEDPMTVVEILAPHVYSTHVKDMGVREYAEGFLLSEVPLGTGILDLPAMVATCQKYNPAVRFSLEMITRDPLKIPCLTEEYWRTFAGVEGPELARTLSMVRAKAAKTDLPKVEQLAEEDRLATEEQNVLDSLAYSRDTLGLM